MAEEKTCTRFSLSQRLEHWVLTISFAALVITGLPQRYALSAWADTTIGLLGGIESVRIIHRIAATILALGAIYHIIAVAYKVYVLRTRMAILPDLKDLTDLLNTIRYNLGLIKKHPKLPRYTFAEKMEYWALIWGTVVMGITGFILWNPVLSARFLPGEVIPAAKAAHSAEALLATLAILVWHVYGVHIKTFNRSMFTGKLTREQMLEEHAGELEEIESEGALPPAISATLKRRREIFLPLAATGAVIIGFGLYAFISIEKTAISTAPPVEMAQAFVPATPTPNPTPHPTATPDRDEEETPAFTMDQELQANASFISHLLKEHEDCLLCHATDAVFPFPADHTERPVSTCLVCHIAEDQQDGLPQPVQHTIEGRDDCVECHALDLLPKSHQPISFASKDCLLCHSADDTTTTETTDGDVSFANDILPLLEANCAMCHGETALGELDLTNYQSFAAGGQSGPALVAGSPDESLIVTTMRGEHPGMLSDADLQKLVDWITTGAENN